MSIQLLKLRGSCHLQDAGRVGQGGVGMPQGGFADRESAELANLIVGKKGIATLLECTLGGPDLHFETSCDIAITGANIQPKIDGVPVPLWQRIHAQAGSTLTCSHARDGLRSYIAFGRSIVAPHWRGSVSPVLLGDEMYPATSVLEEGTTLRLAGEHQPRQSRIARSYVQLPKHMSVLAKGGEVHLNLHAAPESVLMLGNEKLLKAFSQTAWEISPQSNRMGIRLVGPSLPLGKTSGSMRSGPVLPGTVQLLPDGQLIITHVDSQTIGGYPRIGIVDAFGMGVLAQAVAGRVKLQLRF
ncbi:MAG: biotin-dependent carboxyltransferase family protein [Saprospiraceae bacterium]